MSTNTTLTTEDQEMFIRYIKKMVPEIMLSWNIEKKEAIKLAAERWNDMSMTQKQKYDKQANSANLVKSFKPTQSQPQSQKTQVEKFVPSQPVLVPVRPKRNNSAYMFFMNKHMKTEKAKLAEDQPMKVTEFTISGAKIWKEMTDEQKVEFNVLSQNDKVRFDKECDDLEKNGFYINSAGVNSKDMEPKYKKFKKSQPQVNQQPSFIAPRPKKACVAFMFYVKARSAIVTKEREDVKTAADAIKILGKEWGEMSDEAKQPYNDLRAKDIERHEKQMKELGETGQWTLADGSSSKDLAPKKQKMKRGPLLQKRVHANIADNQDEKITPKAQKQKTQQ